MSSSDSTTESSPEKQRQAKGDMLESQRHTVKVPPPPDQNSADTLLRRDS